MIATILALAFVACSPPMARPVVESASPVVIRYAPPRYTEAARRARIQGTVSIEAIVGPDGTVKVQRVVHELPMGLPESSLRALPSWRFNRSALSERRAIIEFVFQLRSPECPPTGFKFEEPYRLVSWAPSPCLGCEPADPGC